LLPETSYVHGWHIDFIARHLEAITHGEFLAKGMDNRLLVNVPPSMMKSLILTVFWPAWEWGPAGFKHHQIIATSFREDFCKRDSRRFRTLVSSDWFQARWPCSLTIVNESHVENAHGGWREAVPFGSLTGGKCDRLLIDDPHSVETAESDADRERTTIRFRESATTRLNDPVRSAIAILMQRLHQRDVSGTILQLGLPYCHIMLPMRFEKDRACVTPFGRDGRTQDGELLFPERFPPDVVDRDEKAMGAIAVAGQHQQRPSPRGGLLFKRHWFGVVPAAPAGCKWVRGWDLAASEEKGAAYTVGVKLGFHPIERRYYVAHVTRDRVSNPEPMIVRTAKQDGIEVEISLPQDPGSAGKIQARALVAALSGFHAYATPESGEKEQRAMPFAAQAEAGNVFLVEGGWNDAYLDEIETFPTGFKDQVDASSRAFGRFVLMGVHRIVGPQVGIIPRLPWGEAEDATNPALGDGAGTRGTGGGTGLEHLGIMR